MFLFENNMKKYVYLWHATVYKSLKLTMLLSIVDKYLIVFLFETNNIRSYR